MKIFPLIVRPCAWKKIEWLEKIQVRPRDGKALSGCTEHEADVNLYELAVEVEEILTRADCINEDKKNGNCTTSLNFPIIGADLFGRDKYLERLDNAWENPHMNVVSFIAFGGVGKTALVSKWLINISSDNYRGAERVYGWSFYSQGAAEGRQASADRFIADALRWFGDPKPDEGSPENKGKRLVSLVRKQRTLLILDGLEPLQYPPGPQEGRLKDYGLRILLRDLAMQNPGLCIITTRLKTDDLSNFIGTTVERIDLEHLSPEPGAMLLKHLGIKGTDRELRQAVEEFDGHALALNLLGTYLDAVYNGEIRERDKIERLAFEGKSQGKHARWVMESYEKWLETTQEGRQGLNILRIMGLFDRPAERGAIQAVRAEPEIEGLTNDLDISHVQWQFAVQNLRDLRLIAKKNESCPDILDCHPLVREHFGEKVRENNPEAWKEAHSRLYEYYKNLPEKELPDTLEEMEPLFAAVAHGCMSGRYEDSLDTYWRRISREFEAYSIKKLGAYSTNLAVISNFFEIPWSQPASELTNEDKAAVLSWAGFHLWPLGRLREAIESMKAGLDAYAAQKNWEYMAITASNLSGIYLVLGELKQAMSWAKQSVDYADRSEEWKWKIVCRVTLADALHQIGNFLRADSLFRESEAMHKKRGLTSYLFSFEGIHFCDLLLSQMQYLDVQKRSELSLELANKIGFSLPTIGMDKLSLGRAHLLQIQEKGSGDFTLAMDYLNQAVDDLRKAERQDYLSRSLLARSALYRMQQDFFKAWNDLEEAHEIAERGSMGLHLADYHLEAARLHIAQNQPEKARKHLETAEGMIEKMGYGRRKGEVEDLRGVFT
ncbi:MAG: hypothetical protein GY749_28970 [Desulfobacteraceae bacterium]|nr:hypothetical protein [Desulfobacteraceae bacterium]